MPKRRKGGMVVSNDLREIELKCIEIILNAILETAEMIVGSGNVSSVLIEEQKRKLDENAILLGIAGQVNGELIFGLNETALKYIASKMLEMEIDEVNELTTSSMVEFINMISGSATIKLVDHFDSDKLKMSPPLFLKGKDMNIDNRPDTIKSYRVSLDEGIHIDVTVALIDVKKK